MGIVSIRHLRFATLQPFRRFETTFADPGTFSLQSSRNDKSKLFRSISCRHRSQRLQRCSRERGSNLFVPSPFNPIRSPPILVRLARYPILPPPLSLETISTTSEPRSRSSIIGRVDSEEGFEMILKSRLQRPSQPTGKPSISLILHYFNVCFR